MTVELALYKEHAVRLTNSNMFTCDGFDAFPSYAELCAAIDKSLRVTYAPLPVIQLSLGCKLMEYIATRPHRRDAYGGGSQCWVKDAGGRRTTVRNCYADTPENRARFENANALRAEAMRLVDEAAGLMRAMTPPVFEVQP